MKKRKILFYIVMVMYLIFLTGCQQQDYTVHFKKDLVIDYNSNDSPLSLIESIGKTKITKDMIEDDSIIIKNFKISCQPIDTSVEQNYIVIFKTNDPDIKEYKKQVFVKDISAPVISFKQDKISIYSNEIKSLNLNNYIKITDNYDKNPTVEIQSDKMVEAAGEYVVTVTATDINNNISTKQIPLIVKEKEEEKKTANTSKKELSKKAKKTESQQSASNITTDEKKSYPKKETNHKTYSSKMFYFGNTYQLDGKSVVCDMNNVTAICKEYLISSGRSGECIPVTKNGVYIGMQVNIE
jgi:hypothetical protein